MKSNQPRENNCSLVPAIVAKEFQTVIYISTTEHLLQYIENKSKVSI